tara:strand:+ start:168 stop:386 length:219 start_codon:yes stop_codon:yes gene_type:complete
MELNKIYNEDCLKTMAKMPNNFIDVIITSPPYNKAGYEGKIRKKHKNDSWKISYWTKSWTAFSIPNNLLSKI